MNDIDESTGIAQLKRRLANIEKELNKAFPTALVHTAKTQGDRDLVKNNLSNLRKALSTLLHELQRDYRVVKTNEVFQLFKFHDYVMGLRKRVDNLVYEIDRRQGRQSLIGAPGQLDKSIKQTLVDSSPPPPPNSISNQPVVIGGSLILSIGAFITAAKLWLDKRRREKQQ